MPRLYNKLPAAAWAAGFNLGEGHDHRHTAGYRRTPQVLPVAQAAALEAEERLALPRLAKSEIRFLTSWLPQVGQMTSAMAAGLWTSFSNGLPHAAQSNS